MWFCDHDVDGYFFRLGVMKMFYFLFMILMIFVFGKLFFFGLKAAWGLSKFVLTIILLPITLLMMVSAGLIYFAFIILIIIGIISFFKVNI